MPKSKVDNVDEPSVDDEHLPGKNRNSFLVFQSEYRAKLKDQHPDMSHSDMQAKISAKWKELDEEKKQVRLPKQTHSPGGFFLPDRSSFPDPPVQHTFPGTTHFMFLNFLPWIHDSFDAFSCVLLLLFVRFFFLLDPAAFSASLFAGMVSRSNVRGLI
jgi:hypothetical protein